MDSSNGSDIGQHEPFLPWNKSWGRSGNGTFPVQASLNLPVEAANQKVPLHTSAWTRNSGFFFPVSVRMKPTDERAQCQVLYPQAEGLNPTKHLRRADRQPLKGLPWSATCRFRNR